MLWTFVAALFGVLFCDDQEAAFSCYRTFQTLGLVAAFVSSTGDKSTDDEVDVVGGLRWPPCLSTKLYVISLLLSGPVHILGGLQRVCFSRCIRHLSTSGWPCGCFWFGCRWSSAWLSTKLYVMSVLLAVSLVLYAAAEYTLPRRSRLITGTHHTGTRSFFPPSSSLRDYAQQRRQQRHAASDFDLVVL